MSMKYVLIKYKGIKLLVNEGLSIEPLLANLKELEALNDHSLVLYKDIMSASDDDIKAVEEMKSQLISKIGYRMTGFPFTSHDAELYALDKKLDYDQIELRG